jgi:hypothetical protein
MKDNKHIQSFNEHQENSELFTLELSKEEVMMLRSCLSSLYQNRTPAGDALSFASRLEDKLKDFLK